MFHLLYNLAATQINNGGIQRVRFFYNLQAVS